jgi:hypothetical protein
MYVYILIGIMSIVLAITLAIKNYKIILKLCSKKIYVSDTKRILKAFKQYNWYQCETNDLCLGLRKRNTIEGSQIDAIIFVLRHDGILISILYKNHTHEIKKGIKINNCLNILNKLRNKDWLPMSREDILKTSGF